MVGPLMWHEGEIVDWNDERGFGFVQADAIDGHVFFHIKDFTGRSRRPAVGDFVVLSVGADDKGRKRAVTIAFAERSPLSHEEGHRDGAGPATVAAVSIVTGAFVALLVVDVYFGQLPTWILAAYGLMVPLSIQLYRQDKHAAQHGEWRVSERTLLLVDMLGGWIGAAFAQVALRHKVRKASFQIPFWTIASAHYFLCLVVGSEPLRAAFTSLLQTP